MTRTPSRATAVAAACVAALASVTLVTPAMAQTNSGPTSTATPASRLAAVKTRGDNAIATRQTTLNNDAALVNSAVHLMGSDRSTLAGLIAADQAGLASLQTTINNDTTVSQAVADDQSIVTSYRIYVLVDPKIRLTVTADRGLAAIATFGDLSTKLQSEINADPSGANVAAAQSALNAMNSDVAAANPLVTPVPGEVLPLVPAGYPANKPTLQSAAAALASARKDLRQARSDASQVVSDL